MTARQKLNWSLNKGFSLIELLVVISIIGILVATATVSWTNAQQKSRDSKRKSDVKAIQQALELYLQDNGTYPDNDGNGLIQCSGGSGIDWGSNFTCNSKTYINPLPKDPRGGTSGSIDHSYYYNAGAALPSGAILNYVLNAGLENNRDPDYCTSACAALPCIVDATYSYCVKEP